MIQNKRQGLAVLVAALLLAPCALGNIVIRFGSSDVTVHKGDVFTLDIIADIDQPVLGWGLDLAIDDPSVLSTIGLPAIDANWVGLPFTPDGDGLAAVAFPDGISGTVVLATLTFSADEQGFTLLQLGADDNGLTEGFPLDNSGFGDIKFESAGITVVPLPAAVVLGIVGLGLVAIRRGRKAQ